MKLTYEQKLKAYQDWKSNLKSSVTIAKELHAGETVVRYFLRLADRHGTETLKHTNNKYYSPEEKLRIINRILISNEPILRVSIDEGLRDDSLLRAWIKSYKVSNVRLFKDSLVKIIGDIFDSYDSLINLFGGQCQII